MSDPGENRQNGALTVCMLDLNSAVPYYDAYLCSALKRCQVDVRLAAITYYLDRECFTRRGVQNCAPIDIVGRVNLPPSVRKPLKLAEIGANLAVLTHQFRSAQPDVLHVQYLPLVRLHLNVELAFLEGCHRRGIPIVYTVHDVLPHDSGDKYLKTYARLYKIPDLLICHSDPVRNELISTFGIDGQNIHVIPHGPLFYDQTTEDNNSFRRQLGIQSDAHVVLWQGIVHRYKGIDLLLRAWGMVRKSVPEAHLVIAGTGSPDLLAEIQGQISSLGIGNSVKTCFRYLSTNELLQAYAMADVVVYPYKRVSTSGALMTGLALGKAIVATDLPFFRLALEDGRLGHLVEYDERDLARHIVRMLTNSEERKAIESHVLAKNFGDGAWDNIAKRTCSCYEHLLSGMTTSAG